MRAGRCNRARERRRGVRVAVSPLGASSPQAELSSDGGIRRALERNWRPILSASMIARHIRNHDKENRLEGFLKITTGRPTRLGECGRQSSRDIWEQVLEESGDRKRAPSEGALFFWEGRLVSWAGREEHHRRLRRGRTVETTRAGENRTRARFAAPPQRQAQREAIRPVLPWTRGRPRHWFDGERRRAPFLRGFHQGSE